MTEILVERTAPLEEVRPFFGLAIGFTLNFPRVKEFVKASSVNQKLMYKLVLKRALKETDHIRPFTYVYYYEICKDGHIHMHGMIESEYEYTDTQKVSYIMDLDRQLRICINKLLHLKTPYTNQYVDKFKRIRKPSHCLQILRDETEKIRWEKYIVKSQ